VHTLLPCHREGGALTNPTEKKQNKTKEVAYNLEQANKVFQGKRYKEAPGFYTHGIDSKLHDVGLRKVACDLELCASPPSLR